MKKKISTLIVPCGGRSTRFPGVKPKWMLTYPDGSLMVQKAIGGLKIRSDARKIITVVKEHCIRHDADLVLRQAFGNEVEICILDEFTSSQAETVALTIGKMKVSGSIVIKDSDNYVDVDVTKAGNFLVGVDLRCFQHISNVAAKSFIILKDQNTVADIIEKLVCSNIINIGTYGFQSTDVFMEYFDIARAGGNSDGGEIFLSSIVSIMIKKGMKFNFKEAKDYEDWGSIFDWYRAIRRKKTYFLDIDGVIFVNKGRYGKVNWEHEDIPLKDNVKIIKRLLDNGAQIILCTSRTENHRKKLERSLKLHGIQCHAIVMGCNHAQRVIVNDFSDTNPYPSCSAINLKRDGNDLEKYIRDDEEESL